MSAGSIKMDCEKLINCVQNRRPLWDKQLKLYNNRDVAKNLWSEVATELGVDSEEAKKKWSNLRDQFRKEYYKVNKPGRSGDGAGAIFTSKWAYYNSLVFLSNQIEPRPCHGNLSMQETEKCTSEVCIH